MAAVYGVRRLLRMMPLLACVACSGIGNGDKVNHLQMVSLVGLSATVLPPGIQVPAYQCLRQQLGVYAVFDKSGSGDYTERPGTHWTSSNPDIVHVSDGDDPDPTQPGRVFPKGVITPLRAGTAVITADYVGVRTSVQVNVREPDSIILSTSQYDSSSNASTAGALSIAPNSSQQYYAYARLRDDNDVVTVQDVTGYAQWSIPDDPQGSFATITTHAVGSSSGGGLVIGRGVGGPVTINANFSACPGTQYENITAKLAVSGVSQLSLQHNPSINPAVPLVVGTSEAFQVTGTLNNGATQDLSLQSALSTIGGDGVLTIGGNVGTALALGSTNVVATFNGVLSPQLPVQTQNAVLSNFAIASGDRNQKIPTQGFYNHFHALGTFTPAAGGAPFQQDLTNNVTWATSDAASVVISNAADTAGLAISQKSAQNCVTIGAVLNTDASKTDSTKLGIGVAVSPATCP